MISVEDVLFQHRKVIAATGGADGIRDIDVLDSAINRPFQTFDGDNLYPTLIEKTAALIESIIVNHPFVDGNKRTGYTVLRTFLLVNVIDLIADENSKYNFVISIASGEIHFEEIVTWLLNNTTSIKKIK